MANLIGWAAVAAIKAYRKWLSPIKGFKCAYGKSTGKGTCSGLGLRYFQKTGPLKAIMLLGRQFDRCILAANAQREIGSVLGAYRRLGHIHSPGSQAGFIDCGGCDAPGCDAPNCDLPACDGPNCDTPSCGMYNSQEGFCAGGADPLRCCDLHSSSSCDGNSDGSESKRAQRVERAKSRQEKRADARRSRRGEPKPDGDEMPDDQA